VKQWLDRVSGLVTMYRLILFSLLAIAAVALLLSLIGQLSYGPVELVVTGALAVAVALGGGWLFAAIFRTKAHIESSIITALLIFFLFPPSLDPLTLAGVALAALIASASKYLLAIRGRHLFNPAAIGAAIVAAIGLAVPGLGVATWWVATGFLLPLVAIGAFLILYRTRRLAMGGLFIAVAAAVIVLRMTTTGTPPLEAVATAFTSYPVIFLAGFMLSEPLTLPPRRWQLLTLAVLVALLFAIPYHLGPVYSSPELALVIGNVFAFACGQRRGIRLTLLEKKQLTPTTWEFTFRPSRPVRFTPGQYMELTVHHSKADARGTRRVFSISSAPTTDGPITFAIKLADTSSSFKKAFLALESGSEIRGNLTAGDFALPANPSTPVLLVAGGIGITPFASQLAHATVHGHKRDIIVAYSVSDPGEIAYADLLKKSGVPVILLAPSAPALLPKNWHYAGAGRITRELLLERIPDVARRRAFVSGPPALVNDIRGTLRSLGSRRVTTDYFSGY
jgi:glycine betaine catabolism B